MTEAAAANDETPKVILLVEDDTAVREFLQTRMELFGFTVIAAGTGQEALDLLQQRGDITLLFSDIVMPGGINGIDLAQVVERDFPGIRIVLASGYAGKTLYEESRVSSRVSVLSKPFRSKDLKSKLDEALAAH